MEQSELKEVLNTLETACEKIRKAIENGGGFWATIPNFEQSEFACKCGCGFDDIDYALVLVCQQLRTAYGKPVVISSGCRCEKHNANVGGVVNSRHIHGRAVDFCVKGVTADDVLKELTNFPEIKYSYAIDSAYVHMDLR